jgi:hypothetical protein
MKLSDEARAAAHAHRETQPEVPLDLVRPIELIGFLLLLAMLIVGIAFLFGTAPR